MVEGDGRSGGGDVVEIRGGGAGVEGSSGGEDDDGEGRVVGEDELAQFYHGDEVANAW